MPKFKVITHNTFENVYPVLNASTSDEAIEYVMNLDSAPEFHQRHLGERVMSVEVFEEGEDIIQN